MKHAEYIIKNRRVEVYNSLLGIESISINGKEVSKGFSWFGKDHFFKIGGDEFMIRPYPSLGNWTGVGFSINKNGVPVRIKNHLAKGDKIQLVLKTVITVIIGGVLGICLGSGISEIIELLGNAISYVSGNQ